jgi:hypothetical protein
MVAGGRQNALLHHASFQWTAQRVSIKPRGEAAKSRTLPT